MARLRLELGFASDVKVGDSFVDPLSSSLSGPKVVHGTTAPTVEFDQVTAVGPAAATGADPHRSDVAVAIAVKRRTLASAAGDVRTYQYNRGALVWVMTGDLAQLLR